MPVLAQSSLGIGAAEQQVPSTGLFPSLMHWVNQQQQDFYRALTGALKSMRDDGQAAWYLVGLSFAYGVFHAAGPGHGKAVISSYMLANEVALKRGIMLSFISAFLQGITAIVVVGSIFLFLRGTGISQTGAVWSLEVASYALIALFGLWLLVRKLRALFAARNRPVLAASLSSAAVHDHQHKAATHSHDHGEDCGCGHDHHDHDHHHGVAAAPVHDHHRAHDGHHHHHAPGEACDCDHAHMPDPSALGGEKLKWSDGLGAVLAVGLRPCSGALIVLGFAFLNGLYLGGVASVFAMALGTAITVSAMATLAVTAKNAALRFAGNGVLGANLHHAIEIGGALLVFLLGALLFSASLMA
ncbi:MAG: nickel/cobalt transporter [Notoacmeibacter sp.]|nr:nickel/cobalt transporter [Notoacmeibacter sp.]